MSDKAVALLRDRYGIEGDSYDIMQKLPRHDPRLVAVVEELGAAASGFCAKLEVEEISGRLYRVTEYDGYESVEVPDSLEWVVV